MQGIIWGEPDLAQHCDVVEVITEFGLKLCSTKNYLFKVALPAPQPGFSIFKQIMEVCASPCHT